MKKIGIFVLLGLCALSTAMLYGDNIQNQLGTRLLRLHIIANSNTERDQEIKLAVRDSILEKSDENKTSEELVQSAKAALSELGAGYGARGDVGRYYVPEKSYKSLKLPEGTYNCLRIVLGEGRGENWWCIAYPPLCYSESVFGGMSEEGIKKLSEILDSEALGAIVDKGDINFRFKAAELGKRVADWLR